VREELERLLFEGVSLSDDDERMEGLAEIDVLQLGQRREDQRLKPTDQYFGNKKITIKKNELLVASSTHTIEETRKWHAQC
jgi:hypothetical protein